MSRTVTRGQNISPNISWSEATYSSIVGESLDPINDPEGQNGKITNEPNAINLANMVALADNIFEPLRRAIGNKPINITSFFRSEQVNSRIKGAATFSQHTARNDIPNSGAAIDITAITKHGYTNRDLFNKLTSISQDGKRNFEYDHLIVYTKNRGDYNKSNAAIDFLHVSYNPSGARNKGGGLTQEIVNGNEEPITIKNPEVIPNIGKDFESRATGNQATTDSDIHHLTVDFWFDSQGNHNLHEAFPASKFDHSNPSFTLENVLNFEKDGFRNADRLIIFQPVELSGVVIVEQWEGGVQTAAITNSNQSQQNKLIFKEGTPIHINPSWLKKSSQPDVNRINNEQSEAEFKRLQSLIPQVHSRDIAPFYVEKLRALQSDENYKRRQPTSSDNVILSSQGMEIWIWVRSLGHIYNVTPFVTNLSTNASKQSGSFSFSLAHINRIDGLKPSDNVFFSAFSQGKGNLSFWNKHLSANDIVWIKFEELILETRKNNFIVDKQRLAGQFYDMIGLIDNVSESKNMGSLDYRITVQGRDLSKLFHDDEAIFFPLAVALKARQEMTITSMGGGSNLLSRTFATGQFNYLFAKTFQSIGNIFQFWMSLLINMGIVPDEIDLFSSYIEMRSERVFDAGAITFDHVSGQLVRQGGSMQFTQEMRERQHDRRTYLDTDRTELAKGVHQIIKLTIDERIAKRRVVDASVGNPNGSIVSLFNKICQYPFVEVLMDTYVDEFHIVVRQPPFNRCALLNTETNSEKIHKGWLYEQGPDFVT